MILPHESHGEWGRESILHTLAGMFAWADRWTQARLPEGAAAAGS